MRARGLLAVACALLAPGIALAQSPGPVETTVKYYDASQAGRCKEVWALYSKPMQEHILDEAQGPPEEWLCRKDNRQKRVDARLVRYQGTRRAEVAVFLQARTSKGLWGPATEVRENVPLLREGDRWKIDGPRPMEEAAPGSTLDSAEVYVRISPNPEPGKNQVFEASATLKISRDAIDAVMRDPRAWAATLPSFKALEGFEGTIESGRAVLSFKDPSPSVPVTINLYGRRPDKETVPFTALIWASVGGLKAPVYMSGEWHLSAQSDGGTRAKLVLSIDPRQWPRPERLFSAERMANSLLRLERAASLKMAGAAR